MYVGIPNLVSLLASGIVRRIPHNLPTILAISIPEISKLNILGVLMLAFFFVLFWMIGLMVMPRPRRRGPGIVVQLLGGLLIGFILTAIIGLGAIVVIEGVKPGTLVTVEYGPEEEALGITASVTFTFKDKYGASVVNVANDKAYLILDEELAEKSALELYDMVYRNLLEPDQYMVSDVDANGQATFDMEAGNWRIFYYPGSITLGTSYAPTVFDIETYEDIGTSGTTVKAKTNILYLVKTSELAFCDSVGTTKSSYTIKPSAYPYNLDQFAFWLKPATSDAEAVESYLYFNLTSTNFALDEIRINDEPVDWIKVADISSDDPLYYLYVNAPSGMTHVIRTALPTVISPNKITVTVWGTASGNVTIVFKGVTGDLPCAKTERLERTKEKERAQRKETEGGRGKSDVVFLV